MAYTNVRWMPSVMHTVMGGRVWGCFVVTGTHAAPKAAPCLTGKHSLSLHAECLTPSPPPAPQAPLWHNLDLSPDPQAKGSVPQDCPLFTHQLQVEGPQAAHTSVQPGNKSGVPTTVICQNGSHNSGKHLSLLVHYTVDPWTTWLWKHRSTYMWIFLNKYI